MGAYIVWLVVAGLIIVGVVRTDVRTERAYGLLAFALLAAVALAYLWPPILGASAQADSSEGDNLALALIVGVYAVITIVALALPCIIGLIEMAVERQWRWLGGLLAVIAALAVSAPLVAHLLPRFQAISPMPGSPLLGEAYLLVGGAMVLAVCVGYGIHATWFRSSPAAVPAVSASDLAR